MSQTQRIRDALAGGGKVYILSVYPQRLVATRPFNGYTEYVLPEAVGDEVAVCEVGNAFQRTYVGDGNWTETPVFADEIARDLLTEFASGMIGQDSGYGPGVWLQVTSVPEPEKVAQYKATQENFFQHLVRQADSLFHAGKASQITDLHRAAAKWLKATDYPWMQKLQQKATKECVACYSQIDARASICPVCTSRQPAQQEPQSAPQEAKPAQAKQARGGRDLGKSLDEAVG